MTSSNFISKRRSLVMRGLAISAVVLTHILAYLPGIYTRSEWRVGFTMLDQLLRFSVPLFIFISGYGLAVSYSRRPFVWGEFFRRRLGKLLPLYVLWSAALVMIIGQLPVWSYDNRSTEWWRLVFLGQADYHLYFVPVLIQLYLIFPILWRLRHRPWLILVATWLTQMLMYGWFWQMDNSSDRFEYVLGLSWVGYFGLGMWAALVRVPEKVWRLLRGIFWPVGMMLGYLGVVAIAAGSDPLVALKFTRFEAAGYAVVAVLALSSYPAKADGWFMRFLVWLGSYSYVIYLSHTLALRLIHSALEQTLSTPAWWVVMGAWLLLVGISVKMIGRE